MPKPGLTQHEPGAETAAEHDTANEHDGLQAILSAIDAQLADANQRYSTTFVEIQHKISDMERAADALRDCVPEQLSPAFKRIEAGVSKLSHHFSEPGNGAAAPQSTKDARDLGPASRDDRRQENAGIEMAGMSEPAQSDRSGDWDRASAEALSDFYDSGAAGVSTASHQMSEEIEPPHGVAGVRHEAMSPTPAVDQPWLEARFAEVAKGIERALADIHPAQTIDAINQRFDRFEKQVATKLDGVAKQPDLAIITSIDAQVRDVARRLTASHDQLSRLSVVENQLAELSKQLGELKQAGASNPQPSATDFEAVAKAAAEQTAKQLADARTRDQSLAANELRPLIEQILSESRSGGDTTIALLDTLQQAMIRLLDRVESIEFSQISSAQTKSRLQSIDEPDFVSRPDRNPEPDVDEADQAKSKLDPIAPESHVHGPQQAGVTENAGQVGRNEELRQEFAAQARRAKMRLEEEDEVAGIPVAMMSPPPLPGETQVDADLRGTRPIRHAVATSKPVGPSLPSLRLVIIAVAALAAIGALWYALGSGGDQPVSIQPAVSVPMSQGQQPNTIPTPADEPQRRSDAGSISGTEGQIIAGDEPRGTTTVPLFGVAVDTERPATGADLQLANRHQAMATMSGKIADAIANSATSPVIPASMIPSAAETSAIPVTQRPVQIQMPAASVGPLSLRLAAANGDPSAEFEVGARYAEGKGTTQSFKEAAKWYQLSADQGFAQAQYRLGTLYERGLGLKPDRVLAATWYRRAADQGNIKAMHNLAVLSSNQADQSPDYATAAKWFEEAAKRGLADSQFNLAILYENGLGVKRDMAQAFVWLSLAARDGDGDAVRRRDILRGKLSAAEIAEAERMIAEWKPFPADRTVNDARAAGEAWKKNPKNGVAG